MVQLFYQTGAATQARRTFMSKGDHRRGPTVKNDKPAGSSFQGERNCGRKSIQAWQAEDDCPGYAKDTPSNHPKHSVRRRLDTVLNRSSCLFLSWSDCETLLPLLVPARWSKGTHGIKGAELPPLENVFCPREGQSLDDHNHPTFHIPTSLFGGISRMKCIDNMFDLWRSSSGVYSRARFLLLSSA